MAFLRRPDAVLLRLKSVHRFSRRRNADRLIVAPVEIYWPVATLGK